MSARKIPIGTRSVTGKHAMAGVPYESSLERDLLTLLQFDLNVDKVVTQPVTIEFIDAAGKPRRYTPDVLAHYRQDIPSERCLRPVLCEVKYQDELAENFPELKPKFKAGTVKGGEQWRFFSVVSQLWRR